MERKETLHGIVTALKKFWKIWVGILALAVMILWTGGACRKKVTGDPTQAPVGIAMPTGAVLVTVSNRLISPRIDVVGTVASEENIHLSSRIQAYVKDVYVSSGSKVTKGQALIRLDGREVQEQLAAAEAQLKRAQTDFDRTRRLLETQAATEQAFDAAESAFHAARAEVERVKVMQTYTEIASPIDGVVTERRIEIGDLANPGQVLLSVYDPMNMRLEAPVPVRLIEMLAKGERVEVILERPEQAFAGTVNEIVSEIDPLSRTQKVKIRLEDVDGTVLPGTFGRVWVEESAHEGILVPASCVYRVGQLEFVQVVRDNRLVKRAVRTGPRYAGELEILSGLNDGDVLMAEPLKGE